MQDGLLTVPAELTANKRALYKKKTKNKRWAPQTGQWSISSDFYFFPACAPKIRWHNIYSRAWCVLCLLFMLQNGTRVITGKNFTVYKGEIYFLIVFFWAPCIIIFHFLYWLCPCSPFLLTKKISILFNYYTNNVHKVAH